MKRLHVTHEDYEAMADARHRVGSFICPACQAYHTVNLDGPQAFNWNGSEHAPTLSPSVSITKSERHPGLSPDDPAPSSQYVCDVFVTAGKLRYTSKCTHGRAGKTVDMVELDTYGRRLLKGQTIETVEDELHKRGGREVDLQTGEIK